VEKGGGLAVNRTGPSFALSSKIENDRTAARIECLQVRTTSREESRTRSARHQSRASNTKIVPRSHTHAKRIRVYRNVQKTAPKRGTTPKLRITPVMQGEIVKLYLGGHSLSEISRQTHRARQTVTKVCRGPDIQTMIREQREMWIAESHAWAESINFAVTHELDGRLAFKLAQLFGVIPSPPKKAAP
jgi:hypothetical protein